MTLKSLINIALVSVAVSVCTAKAADHSYQLKDGTPVQVHRIQPALDRNHDEKRLKHQLKSYPAVNPAGSLPAAEEDGFRIPLRRGLSNSDPEIMSIAAFVDHDQVFPDSLLDWNCGDRTYDADTFNHNGTDYNVVQFPWLSMQNEGLVVVAAADGVIIDRHDGEPDQNCGFDLGADANLIVLRHSDNTIGIYAHFKSGTVTPRNVGHNVEQGDYLGVIGSSGISSGPHLHFGVQDRFDNLLDPYAGECNALNPESFWAEQEAYRETRVLDVSTHSALPEYPPCPQVEVPHFQNIFETGDDIFASFTIRDFDGTEGDEVGLELRGPSDQVLLATAFSDDSLEFRSSLTITWGPLNGPQMDPGKYTLSATFGGQSVQHGFYVDDGPEPPPEAKPGNNAFTGLWYDPALDGEGFNIVSADGGTIVYFYGSDSRGNRIWLISDLIPGEIKAGQAIEVLMFESTGGIFATPVKSSRGLSAWGTLTLVFSSCENGQSTLNGADGYKESQLTKLAGVSGADCVDGEAPLDSPWAGLWYDAGKDGEGYNLIVAPPGRILYFYGFGANGKRLWLISELITVMLEAGQTVEVALFEATQGTFDAPVPSSEALVAWGTAQITVIDCNTVTILIEGSDGSKTSNTVRLAGIIGLECTD